MGALGLSNDSGKARHPLPHPPVSLAIFLTLEAAMAEAWRRIHTEPRSRFNTVTALEVNFTAELHEVLRDELLEEESVAGFTKDLFHDVERPEVKNFDGTRISLRPDMMVKLVGRENVKRTQDGIFVEAKLVYKSNGSKRRYCDNGITRFNDGDYAWAMTEAMMLGYSREPQKPSHALVDAFKTRAARIQYGGKLKDCAESPSRPKVAISIHRRNFKVRGQKAGKITLRHLWLQRPDPT